MGLSPKTIQEVQDRAEIEEVVGDYVPLKKKGQNMWACCPFHDEKTPSFSVAPNKGIYKCFGCGKAGDSIQFIMDLEGLNFPEAIRQLADKYGIEIEETESSPEQQEAYNERESLYIVLNFAAEYFKDLLHNHPEGKSIGLSYFKERGFSHATIEEFDLGFTLDQWDGLIKAAKAAGHSEELLEKAGLIIKKEDKTYDRFRNRVIFPIHSISGKPIAFGARILINDKKQPKYINSPETDVYHKSEVLYGIAQAKKSIRDEENCYLVEGYTDVISLHQSGVENVVASSGTSLTTQQIKLIGRYAQNVTVLFDGDAAGLKAAMRGIDLILEGGLNVKVVIFPDGEDPDSYSQKMGDEAFKSFLKENAKDFIRFKSDLLLEETKQDPIKKAETIQDIVRSISKIPDPVKRAIYIKECSDILEIDEALLIAEQNKVVLREKESKGDITKRQANYLSESFSQAPEQIQKQYTPFDVAALQERESIRLLLTYAELPLADDKLVIDYLLQELSDTDFIHPVYAEILEDFVSHLKDGTILNESHFIKNGSEEVRKVIFSLYTDRYELSENWEKKFEIYTPHERHILNDSIYIHVLRLKHRSILHLIDKNTEKLKDSVSQEDEQIILQYLMQLNQAKMEIGNLLGMVVVK
ncbi:DNA primase [Marivirga tractuosa]|uniref:DNA primase n=1 Tax=Marivirga tractuosa (strain ATCC 23168 / DSM 4126 / NBRC 15989 / NCIMB 1408 / VKM B-1430 / H-43) TaxID=643867 RepID=E4TTL6_MARTH|nr:DNA primase [Marivirga tractuosa]ADR20933.1 DNA primase [Marivirga tractuosa DSM 4126]BDD14616.1 DNA primase [Marivirga tractuosa]